WRPGHCYCLERYSKGVIARVFVQVATVGSRPANVSSTREPVNSSTLFTTRKRVSVSIRMCRRLVISLLASSSSAALRLCVRFANAAQDDTLNTRHALVRYDP